jgi:hypothetical protein
MFAPRLSKWHADMLAAAYSLGKDLGQHADAALLLKLLAAAKPGLLEVALAQSIELLEVRDIAGARALLEKAYAAHPANALVNALLAWCLFMQRDGLWEIYVKESQALPAYSSSAALIEALGKASGRQLGVDVSGADRDPPSETWMPPPIGLAC